MSQAVGSQEALRRLAMVDEGFVEAAAGLRLGYDIEAALIEPDD